MEGENSVTPSISDELLSWDIQGDQKGSESGATRSIIDEFHSVDIQRDQTECECGDARSIIDELHFSDLVKWKVKVMLLEVSLMNFNLGISKEI